MNTYQCVRPDCKLQVYAKGNATSGIGILFLHGGPGSGAQAIMELPAFQRLEEFFHCTYFDQRGCGASSYPIEKGIKMEDIIADVEAVAKDLKQRWNLNYLFLWGGSFGGYLASLCMERIHGIFDGCMLSSPAITFSRKQAMEMYEHMKTPYEQRMPALSEQALSSDVDTPEAFFQNPMIRDFIFSEKNNSNSLRHICAMSSWFFQHHFPNLFTNLPVPTLVLQGKDDPICKYEVLDKQLEKHKHPNLTYFLLPGAGHAVFQDKEDDFVKYIKAFIEEVSAC